MDNPAQPRLAATVMLLRERGGIMEVFMIVRHQGNDFASGALVFPGGRVDPEDHLIANDAALFPPQPGVDAAVAAVYVAAMRETFEECGVLLARARGETTLASAARLHDIEAVQGECTFGQMLVAENLVLAPDTLTPFAHWITPERVPKRFDTHFFSRRPRRIRWRCTMARRPSIQCGFHPRPRSTRQRRAHVSWYSQRR